MMKKQLLGTTTLVAAGLLLGQGAYAAEPMSVSLGGYYVAAFQYLDLGDQNGGPGASLRDHEFWDDGEIQFSASGELDNGISVGVRIEYEAQNQGAGASIVDERYVTFSGGFGMLRIGSDDPAANQMHYIGPVAAGTAWWVGVASGSAALIGGGGSIGQVANGASSGLATAPGISGDAQKIIYFTPRMGGFQLGVSYAPDQGSNGPAFTPSIDNAAGVQNNELSAGVNYQGNFDAVSVSASAGFASSTVEAFSATATDRDNYALGLNFGFENISVGGSYRHEDAGGINTDSDTFAIGATYAAGPVNWGIAYAHNDSEITATAEDELDAFGLTADYSVGPGVTVFGTLKHYDYSSDTAGTATPDGIAMALGTIVYF